MITDKNKFAAVLLCSSIVGANGSALTILQWHKCISYLYSNGIKNPFALIGLDNAQLRRIITDNRISAKILNLKRFSSECEKRLDYLEKQQIKIIAMDESEYPSLILQKLQQKAPPILFAKGNLQLLNSTAIAVTGCRCPSSNGIEFAKVVGRHIAKCNHTVVSGGAKGCDDFAVSAAIQNGANAVLYLAAPLVSVNNNASYKKLIQLNRACFVSDHNPFGEFLSWQALKRNEYIYSSANAAFICECSGLHGGTYSGAKNAIDNNLCKIYVNNDSSMLGNIDLIKSGATAVEIINEKIEIQK